MKPLSVYIHIPFCYAKCAYCNFISFDSAAERIEAYVDALVSEIRSCKYKNEYQVQTIFFGGGTPSFLTTTQIIKVFNALSDSFKLEVNAEITIECNPESITREKFACYKKLGINRISIGVQSFNDEVLKILGRAHSVKKALEAINLAGEYFSNINIDLIHSVAVAENPVNNIQASIGEFGIFPRIRSRITHVSLYSLTLEDGTQLKQLVDSGKLVAISENNSIKEQNLIESCLREHGFKKYEVSNFAKQGYQCRHNMTYWTGDEYLGLGLAAHSFINNERFSNTEDLEYYITHPNSNRQKPHHLTLEDSINECIMLRLRTVRGINLKMLTELGYDLLKEKSTEISELQKQKLIRLTKTHLRATHKGFFLLNQVIKNLTP